MAGMDKRPSVHQDSITAYPARGEPVAGRTAKALAEKISEHLNLQPVFILSSSLSSKNKNQMSRGGHRGFLSLT